MPKHTSYILYTVKNSLETFFSFVVDNIRLENVNKTSTLFFLLLS
jgi:hypothetical protein